MTDDHGLARPDIVTARLRLRRPHDGDIDAIVAIAGDRAVARQLARVPHPYRPSDARFFLDHVVPDEWVWAITLPDAGDLVGVVGLTPGADAAVAELGYWLAPPLWGRGIAGEAAAAVVAWGFAQPGLARIVAGHFADNPASGRLLARLGFVETGHATRPSRARGADVPSVELLLSARPRR